MTRDIYQQQIVPDKPRILDQERIYVYMPSATASTKGLAAFNTRDFIAPDGYVSLRWPMEMLIERLANPALRPSYIKVLGDEFVNTNNPVSITHPTTSTRYISTTAEMAINRKLRTALTRPDLVMLDADDFTETTNENDHNVYTIKRKDPFASRTIIKLDSEDFDHINETATIKWPIAHSGEGSHNTNGYGLVKITDGTLQYNDGNLEVNISGVIDELGDYINPRMTYSNDWVDKDKYINADNTARRDESGAPMIVITKDSVGLSNVENRTFASRTYNEFGRDMKNTFDQRFNTKLDQTKWDGPAGLFRDWAPYTNDRNTVQKWFMRLEEEDNSIWSSIRTLRLFLGFFETPEEVTLAYPPEASLYGCHAFITDTLSYWSVRPKNMDRYQFVYRDHTGLESISGMQDGDRAVNINNNHEHIWNGSIWVYDGIHNDEWTWYNTLMSSPTFFDYVESDAGALQPNAPVANVSVGTSGKWIQSDHVHPSDPTKLDASALESATITITTNEPGEDDFFLKVTSVIILDHNDEQIDAVIVPTPQYLGQVPNPQNGDLAIARNLGKIYRYNGTSWIDTNTLGTILYDANNSVNIPYVRTSQYLHNWKYSPTEFNHTAESEEIYWSGTQAEFDQLDLSDIPQNALMIVTDANDTYTGHFVTEEQLDELGLTVSTEIRPSTDRVVITTENNKIAGLPLTIRKVIVNGKPKYQTEALNFGTAGIAPNDTHTMAIVVDSPNGKTLSHRKFKTNRTAVTDIHGNLNTIELNPLNIITSSHSTTETTLVSNRLIVSGPNNTVVTHNTGNIQNRPIVSDGNDGVTSVTLRSRKLISADEFGGLTSTDLEATDIILDAGIAENQLIVGTSDGNITTWASNAVSGALLVQGTSAGTIVGIKHNSNNRIIVTGPNGTITELGEGSPGQYLAAGASGNAPGWVTGPTTQDNTPQRMLTSNPSITEANSFKGLVAVVLNQAIPNSELRPNCIYYW